MAAEGDVLKQEHLFVREITQAFERAISRLNVHKKVNLRSAVGRTTVINKLHKRTEAVYMLGKGNARQDIKTALKRISAAKAAPTFSGEIAEGVVLGPFEDKLVNKYTQQSVAYMDFMAKDVQAKMNDSLQEGFLLGESVPKLTKRVESVWGSNKVRATRFARTQTNSVYNAAHVHTYTAEPLIECVQFVARLDSRVSEQCRSYDGTIWKLSDSSLRRPPLHFNCRSRLVAWPYSYPGNRDFTKMSDGTTNTYSQLAEVNKQIKTFNEKYWKEIKVTVRATRAGKVGTVASTAAPKFTTEEIDFMKYEFETNEMKEDMFDRLYSKMLTDEEKSAVKAYTGSDYRLMNEYLRTGKIPENYLRHNISLEEVTARAQALIDNMDSAFSKAKLSKNMTVHRGISADVAEGMLKTGRLEYAGYSSTSESLKTARYFARENSVSALGEAGYNLKYKDVLVFDVKKGAKGIHYGGGEAEIILDRGLKLEVIKIQLVEDVEYLLGRHDAYRFIHCKII